MPTVDALEKQTENLNSNAAEIALRERLMAYDGRPVRYAREHLGRFVTPKQAEILHKLQTPPFRVLARSANTQGKTFVGALKCSHFFDTRTPSITIATAPVYAQVRDLIFKELRTIRPTLAGFMPKSTRLEAAHDHYIDGLTANTPDAFQGRHGKYVGLMFDEATGIDKEFFERGETMFESTGDHWWLAAYNPNDPSSYIYQLEEAQTWHVVQLNALEHPNVIAELNGQPPPIPGAIRLDTIIRRMASECELRTGGDINPLTDFNFPEGSEYWWRAKNPAFEAQVLGRWPLQPTTSLWSPTMFDRCCFVRALNPDWGFAVGCDVARFGDDKTTIAIRQGPILRALYTYSGVDTTWIAKRIRDVIHEHLWCLGAEQRMILAPQIPCYIDDTGGYGAGVIDQANGYRYIGLNMSSKSTDPRFPNLRSQIWCQLADAAAYDAVNFAHLSSEDRRALKTELTAARYRLDYAGSRVVEPKAHIKERIGRSPDRADAVVLCYSLAAE